eukprot:TRINITY_DN2143_c0_g1_i1.p1 TRINITY_DN2143_c0_g1~~TRINITY_DN2143_c0_g1_i1.p1  ORF type:complete len:794 (+),score=215.97 TRINITY_DN2143_c0_g1_i1:62-2443(+)
MKCMQLLQHAFLVAVAAALVAARGSTAVTVNQGRRSHDSHGVHGVGPITEATDLLNKLHQDIMNEVMQERLLYKEYEDWCSSAAKQAQKKIVGKEQGKDFQLAAIAKADADISSAELHLQELATRDSGDEADLREATITRDREKTEFKKTQLDIVEGLQVTKRAIDILAKQVIADGGDPNTGQPAPPPPPPAPPPPPPQQQNSSSNSSSFLQLKSHHGSHHKSHHGSHHKMSEKKEKRMAALSSALSELAQVSGSLTGGDAAAFHSLLGTTQRLAERPTTGQTLVLLKDVKSKSELSLMNLQKKEDKKQSDYDNLKLALGGKIEITKVDMKETKETQAKATESKAISMSELRLIRADLSALKKYLLQIERICMDRASQYQRQTQIRINEQEAILQAKRALGTLLRAASGYKSISPDAIDKKKVFTAKDADKKVKKKEKVDLEENSWGDDDFLQLSSIRSGTGTTSMVERRILERVKQMAANSSYFELAQLSAQVSELDGRTQMSPADRMAGVKKLINDMIDSLKKANNDDIDKKTFCKQEMARTEMSKKIKTDDAEQKQKTSDVSSASLRMIRQELADLSRELAGMAESEKVAAAVREKEHAEHVKAFNNIKSGLAGIVSTLRALRNYYGIDSDVQADRPLAADMRKLASGQIPSRAVIPRGSHESKEVVSLLEMVEESFTKDMTNLQAQDKAGTENFNELMKVANVLRTQKNVDIAHKTKTATTLERAMEEDEFDARSAADQLSAISDYRAKLDLECGDATDAERETRLLRRKGEIKDMKELLEELLSIVVE